MKFPSYNVYQARIILLGLKNGQDNQAIAKEYKKNFGTANKGTISNKIKFFEELGFIEGEAYQTKKLTNTGEYYLGVFEMLYRAHLKTYGNKNNKRVQ